MAMGRDRVGKVGKQLGMGVGVSSLLGFTTVLWVWGAHLGRYGYVFPGLDQWTCLGNAGIEMTTMSSRSSGMYPCF